MPESTTAERQLIEQFLETLRALPEVQVNLVNKKTMDAAGDKQYDAKFDLHIAGKSFTLLIETKKTVYPRDVRQVSWQLKEHNHNKPNGQGGNEPVSLLVAESISPGAKDLLRSMHVGYYDSGGSLYLAAHGTYIYIDRPPPKSLAKSIGSLYSGRRAQVLHALLVHHSDWFSVKELAALAQVSSATVSQVLSELERFDWLISRGKGPSKERHVSEPASLLDAWVKQSMLVRPQALQRYYVPGLNAEQLLERIGQVFTTRQIGYAISHEAAAQRYAPFLSSISQVRCRLLVGPASAAAIGELGARAVDEGANLVIIEAKSPGDLLFREYVGNTWLASPIHVYLDLLRGEGRTKEMAEHLRQEMIGF